MGVVRKRDRNNSARGQTSNHKKLTSETEVRSNQDWTNSLSLLSQGCRYRSIGASPDDFLDALEDQVSSEGNAADKAAQKDAGTNRGSYSGSSMQCLGRRNGGAEDESISLPTRMTLSSPGGWKRDSGDRFMSSDLYDPEYLIPLNMGSEVESGEQRRRVELGPELPAPANSNEERLSRLLLTNDPILVDSDSDNCDSEYHGFEDFDCPPYAHSSLPQGARARATPNPRPLFSRSTGGFQLFNHPRALRHLSISSVGSKSMDLESVCPPPSPGTVACTLAASSGSTPMDLGSRCTSPICAEPLGPSDHHVAAALFPVGISDPELASQLKDNSLREPVPRPGPKAVPSRSSISFDPSRQALISSLAACQTNQALGGRSKGKEAAPATEFVGEPPDLLSGPTDRGFLSLESNPCSTDKIETPEVSPEGVNYDYLLSVLSRLAETISNISLSKTPMTLKMSNAGRNDRT